MPEDMAGHVRILRLAIDAVKNDSRMMALQVQGSVGRGTADCYSDLDLGLVVHEGAWPSIAEDVPAMVRRWGEVVDDRQHLLPNADLPDALRAWAQFANGIQLDLLVLPATRFLGSGPDGRTLFDPEGIILPSDHPQRVAGAETVAGWASVCWHALTETAKYLERGRPVAAAEWLYPARQATISCWAAAHGLEFAAFPNVMAAQLGVSCPWPVGLEKTYSVPEPQAVLNAARDLADLQVRTDALLEARLGIKPRPLAGWMSSRLAALQAAPSRQGSPPVRRSRQETKRPGARRSV